MTGATSKRVGDLINDVEEKRLVLRPYFQRRLVWTNVNKDKFLDTVSHNLPFPEIFIATGQLDTKSMRRENWLVDGQQRISTLQAYVRGSPDLILKSVKPYAELTEDEKTRFLNYEVAVRDLGTVTEEQIKDIFSRINSTDYALNTMEKQNALYSGAYKQFSENLSHDPFFERHNVFTLVDQRRMRDLDFCVILTTTLLSTYYHRGELNREYLTRYNDDFTERDRLRRELEAVFDFVERCGFDDKARVWKKTDLFTLLVELHSAIVVRRLPLDAVPVGVRLATFYSQVDDLYKMGRTADSNAAQIEPEVFGYLKAATKATNDKYARSDRGRIIAELLESTLPESPPKTKPTRKGRKRS